MNKRSLKITLGPDWKSALRMAAQASLEADYQGETLNFESPVQFFGQLTERHWELVRIAQGKPPMTVRELVHISGRNARQVNEAVKILTQLGLVERTNHAGVVCPYNCVHIDMHLQAT